MELPGSCAAWPGIGVPREASGEEHLQQCCVLSLGLCNSLLMVASTGHHALLAFSR